MNTDTLSGKWSEVKGKVRHKWGKLTDSEIDKIAGKREELLGKIQQAYGLARDEADKQLNEFEDAIKKAN